MVKKVGDTNVINFSPLDNRPETGSGGAYELIATFVNQDINGSITQINTVTPLPITNQVEVIGSDGNSEVGDRDVDFFRFNSAEAGILEIDIDASTIDFVDTVALIFDENGNRLAVNDDTDGLDPFLQFQIDPNTDYYVAITGYGNENFDPFALGSGSGGDTGEYTINSRLLPLDSSNSLNNDRINDETVENIQEEEPVFGNIGEDDGFVVGPADIDIYRYVATTDGTLNIRTTANEDFNADTFLRFFDANGDEIAFNDDENPFTRGSFLEVEIQAGTEYYIGVNGFSEEARNYDPLTGFGAAPGSQGGYTLSIESEPELAPAPLPPRVDVDDVLGPNEGSTVFRFFRPDEGVHFYTAGEREKDSIIENLPQFNFEGPSFVGAPEPAEGQDPLTGVRPVYRFLNNDTGVHLYTIGENERNALEELSNYTAEGIAYYAYETEQEETISLYRFYNSVIDTHFYTPGINERNNVLETLPDYQLEGRGGNEEGIAFYVNPTTEI